MTLLLVLQAAPAAAADRAFTARFSANDTGNITIAANTLLTCRPPTRPVRARRRAERLNNNQFTMAYVDVDSNADHV